MEVWLSYSLGDLLLFAPATYHRLVERYNAAIWPGQVLALGAAVAVFWLVARPMPGQGRVVAGLLALGWLWVAWAFHLERYATINWAARWFAAGFVLQAALLAWSGLARGQLVFRWGSGAAGRAGALLFLAAVLAQPLLGLVGERAWRAVELAGLAPDPTAVATLGLLLAVPGRVPWGLLVLPLAWCAVAGATAWAMEAPDAWFPWAAALAALLLAARKSLTRAEEASA